MDAVLNAISWSRFSYSPFVLQIYIGTQSLRRLHVLVCEGQTCCACGSDSYSRGALIVVSRERQRCNAINPDGRFSVYWVAVGVFFFL
jgi:hypothetical protein